MSVCSFSQNDAPNDGSYAVVTTPLSLPFSATIWCYTLLHIFSISKVHYLHIFTVRHLLRYIYFNPESYSTILIIYLCNDIENQALFLRMSISSLELYDGSYMRLIRNQYQRHKFIGESSSVHHLWCFFLMLTKATKSTLKHTRQHWLFIHDEETKNSFYGQRRRTTHRTITTQNNLSFSAQKQRKTTFLFSLFCSYKNNSKQHLHQHLTRHR